MWDLCVPFKSRVSIANKTSGPPERKPCWLSKPNSPGTGLSWKDPWSGKTQVALRPLLVEENLWNCHYSPVCGLLAHGRHSMGPQSQTQLSDKAYTLPMGIGLDYTAILPLLPISLWFLYSFSFRRSFLWVSRSFSSIVALWIVVIFVWEEVNLGFSYSVILATLLTTLSFITLLVVNLENYNMHSWLKPACN